MKIRQEGAEFPADRRTDRQIGMTTPTVAFCTLKSAMLGGVLCFSVRIYKPGRVRKNGLRFWTHTYRESTLPRKWLVPGASSRHFTDCFSGGALLQLLHQHRGQCAVLCFQFLDASLQRHYLLPQTLHMTPWNILSSD